VIIYFYNFSRIDVNEHTTPKLDSTESSNVSGSSGEGSIETEESGSDHDHIELDNNDKLPSKKAQKIKNFFSFGRKKEKVV